jgi:hypothetical protein
VKFVDLVALGRRSNRKVESFHLEIAIERERRRQTLSTHKREADMVDQRDIRHSPIGRHGNIVKSRIDPQHVDDREEVIEKRDNGARPETSMN